jgi:uncharacterized protein YciI
MKHTRIAIVAVLTAILFTGLVTLNRPGRAQQKQTLFIGLFKAANPDFVKQGPSPADMPLLRKHVEYLQKLTDQGISVVAGHTLNHDESAFGIVILRTDSESSARKILAEDALVQAGLVKVQVFQFEGLIGK